MRRRVGTLRFRLMLWYALNLTLVVAALGVLVYGVVRYQLLVHHDGELRHAALEAARVLAREADCERLGSDQVADLDRLGHVILFHEAEGEGRVFYRSPDASEMPVPQSAFASDAPEGGAFQTLDTASGMVRAFSFPYRAHSGRRGVIHVLEKLGDVAAPLAGLRLALLMMAPIAVLASAAGGYWLVGRTLARVDEITRLAREIEAESLGRRLPEPPVLDEIGRLVATLNQMVARLQASFEGMKRFTADASHELRTPLANMRAAIDVALARPREAAEYERVLGSVGEDVDRLRSIVGELLVLARADSGRIVLERAPTRLDVLAVEVAESFQPAAAALGVSVSTDCPSPVVVSGDERWLRQLLANLVGNAVKFTPGDQGGPARVVVSVEASKGAATLQVTDTGPGFRAEALPHVFDRFYRADDMRAGREGSGLGLAIAAWIVEAHGGQIVASNRPEGGAVCAVTLPPDGGLGAEEFRS